MLFIGVVAQPVGSRIYDRFGGRNLFVLKPGNDTFGSAFPKPQGLCPWWQ